MAQNPQAKITFGDFKLNESTCYHLNVNYE